MMALAQQDKATAWAAEQAQGEFSSAVLEERLLLVAEIMLYRPEAAAIFERLEQELALAKARESRDPVARARALRAAQSASGSSKSRI